ncbi:MAG: Cof-type HAD-IIB family hydrolase [Eubacteriales bacterium]
MDIKLVVTDLDDTLISENTGITQRAYDTIAKVQKKGIKVSIATGRMHTSAFPYARELDINEPIISYNGALVKHAKTGENILHLPVDYNYAVEVLEFAKEHNQYIQYYSKEDYFVYEHCAKSERYEYLTGIRAKETKKDLLKVLDFSPTKMLIICDEKESERIYNLALKKFENRLQITRSSGTYVEFNNINASKGNACKALAEYYGFTLENTMSIGNGGNDVDMIEKCGLGVAVENAVQEAKDAADYICPSQEKDGAIEAMERFLLNR